MSSRLHHPGYIAFKAACASLLALTLVNALGIDDKLSAPFVAVVCTTPTVFTGIRRGFGQLVASALGGGIALLMSLWAPLWLTMLVAIFATIWISFWVGIGRDYVVAAFTVLYVILIPGKAAHTLEHRLASVAVGVLSAAVLNVLISYFRRRQVFRRRLEIARETVAEEFRKTGQALRTPGTANVSQLFEPAFVLLRSLSEELTDAARELGGSSRWKTQAQGACEATQQLLAVAHYGKDLLLAWQKQQTEMPAESRAAELLATAIAADAPVEVLNLAPDSPGCRSLLSAAESWTRARAALAVFQRDPRSS